MTLQIMNEFGYIYLKKTLNDMEFFVEEALDNKKSGKEFPFVIKLRKNDKIIGFTRFLDILPLMGELGILLTAFHQPTAL